MRSHLLIERPPDHARLILFVDDGNIAAMRGMKRRIGNQRSAAHKFPHNPLISPEHPWEGENVFPSATVLYDPEALRYRMWYHASRQLSAREELCALCYATSGDALVCIAEPSATGIANNGAPQEFIAYYRLPLRVAAQPTLCRMQSHDLHHWNPHPWLFTAEAIPFDGNAIYHRVGWREHDDLSDLGGQRTIRLRFIVCRAALYSFRLAHPEASVTDLLAGIC